MLSHFNLRFLCRDNNFTVLWLSPCLVLVSDQDPLHPYHFGEVLREAIPNAELRTVISRYVDDERHNVEVKEQVASFIAKHF